MNKDFIIPGLLPLAPVLYPFPEYYWFGTGPSPEEEPEEEEQEVTP